MSKLITKGMVAIMVILTTATLLAGSALASDSGVRPFSTGKVHLMSDSGVRPF